MNSFVTLLFFAILLTPIGFIIGVATWIIGAFLKGDSEQPHPAQAIGKKMMLFSLFAFAIGFGSCWGLIGLEDIFRRVF